MDELTSKKVRELKLSWIMTLLETRLMLLEEASVALHNNDNESLEEAYQNIEALDNDIKLAMDGYRENYPDSLI